MSRVSSLGGVSERTGEKRRGHLYTGEHSRGYYG